MKYLAIHHTAVSRDKQSSQLMPVNRYHKGKWNFKSSLGWFVGYNYFIDVNGSLTYCRKIGEETIAQKGHNLDTISVCLAGNFNSELPNDKQVSRLQAFLKDTVKRNIGIEITYHRKLQANRTCPGKLFNDEYMSRVILKEETVPDPEDKEKSEQILKLSTQLDTLIALIKKLLSIFNVRR